MYCKNCGNTVDPHAAVCVKCGTSIGQGEHFCGNCGNELTPGAAVCMSCGFAVNNKAIAAPGAKSKILAGLLGIFLGTFGVHNFYLGYTKKAVIQLVCSIVGIILSCIVIGAFIAAGIGIWGLVEGIMILCGKIDTDADGNALAD
ncbi:MAG: TM2 domain-containing protein [Ruminococcus sp.]|nr:TM2 domain-containing protein [Ruminococcus sp.]